MGPGLARALAEQVRAQLAVLDLQAAGVVRRAVDVQVVCGQLRSLIGVWRRLLEAHHPPDGTSRCPRCRSWWGRRRRWPCPVWRTAHSSLAVHQVPAPDAVASAAAWVRTASPVRPLGVRIIPKSRQSPAGRNAPRAGGTPGAATPDPTAPPTGAAAPGTSRRAAMNHPPTAPWMPAAHGKLVEVPAARNRQHIPGPRPARGTARPAPIARAVDRS